MSFPLAIPTIATPGGDLARQFCKLRGPAFQAPDGSLDAFEAVALGDALATARQTTLNAINEAIPGLASQLLSEWEDHLAIQKHPEQTAAQRNAAILAHWQAMRGSSYQVWLTVTTLAGGTVVNVIEPSIWSGLGRLVYLVEIQVTTALSTDVQFLASVNEILDRMMPAWCSWKITHW